MDTGRRVEKPGKRLALFFDGTWNEPPDHTNVRRLRLMLAERGEDGVPQRAFYDAGVGTRWYDRLSGGMFGAGLSENVREGYRWLTENYERGDEIYLFGFSRGAFTARSLAGIIARCGLLTPDAPISFAQLFERYQRGMAARSIYDLIRNKSEFASWDYEEQALLHHTYYRRNLIKMVGVFDTVGSIGVPLGSIKGISRRTLKFHNTRLSTTIEHSYQALALDEYRSPYSAILWTEFRRQEDSSEEARKDERWIEQRWFSGAHADVGGGYRSNPLPDRPLGWLQTKAAACGLAFRCEVRESAAPLKHPVRDSYSEFLRGWWKKVTLGRRHVRPVLAPPVATLAGASSANPVKGWVQTVNERIDESVFERCGADTSYRPPGLLGLCARRGIDLGALLADTAALRSLSAPVVVAGVELQPLPTRFSDPEPGL